MSRPVRIVRDVALVAILFAGIHYFQTRDLPSGPAPALVGRGLDGETVDLAEFRGEPVVVYFWASWCGVCKAMSGNVDSLAEETTVVRVAVRSGGADEVASALPSETARAERVVVDAGAELAASWGVGAFPTLVWVGPSGEIRFVEVGYTTTLGMKARSFFASF